MFRAILTVVLLVSAANPAKAEDFEGIKTVSYFGYGSAIELKNAHVRVVLCPEIGGRVLEYSLNEKNVLYLSDDEKSWQPGQPAKSSAGRFDIGPELVIPKRELLWSGPWTGELVGDRHARLKSGDDPATGVRLVRDFVLDAKTSKLSCTQTILNVSTKTTEWCHWSRTFAVGKGICVIPLSENSRFPKSYVMYEEGTVINMSPEDPNIRVRDGYLEILSAARKPKLGLDSYAGVIAYYAPNDLLFVKRFKTFPDRVYNEAAGLTISVWYPSGNMVELEPIGPRERLAPGESGSFTEEWWLAEMPFPKGAQVDLNALNATTEKMK